MITVPALRMYELNKAKKPPGEAQRPTGEAWQPPGEASVALRMAPYGVRTPPCGLWQAGGGWRRLEEEPPGTTACRNNAPCALCGPFSGLAMVPWQLQRRAEGEGVLPPPLSWGGGR